MTTIELDEKIAQALEEAARSRGMTVQEYVRSHVVGKQNGIHASDARCDVDFDSELDGLLFSGPTLPADFSRADIYSDHE